MIRESTLHILNGQSMYDFFKKTNFLEKELMIPFNEAMCFGDTSIELFTQDFVEIRAKVHQVTPEQYIEITLKPLQPLFRKNFTRIALWFDADMFCQINILTILAWLDRTGHNNTIDLHLVGDKFKPVESFTLEVNGYDQFYKQVLIHKTMPKSISPAPLMKGVELYLTYLNSNSNLMLYIQEHKYVPEKELVSSLIEKFTEYGLGDVQYLELIRAQRK
ncbi:hypothetical protein [Neobacillus niacini]|uniref:hypothetical protein n=1 Tax=Neobacillus niacini TaxID=86668 RepID=UPI0006946A05|nr:hypothetical protein [Neobacillus niacini]